MFLSVPVVATLVFPHVTSELGLTGLCLAAWAQPRRRWVLMGLGLAIGFVRPPNALPLLAVLIYVSRGEPLGLLKAGIAGAAGMLPLLALAFWLDPAWVSVYLAHVGHTDYAGLPQIAINLGGTWGLVVLQVAVILGALALARTYGRRALDADLAAYVIAISVLSSKLAGPYSGVYALPALARVGLRPQLAWTPWFASGLGWLMELSFLPVMLAGALAPPAWESVIAYVFVFASWPLARQARRPGRLAAVAPRS